MTRPPVLDPLATSDHLEHDYRSYLTTTFNPADPALRADLASALSGTGSQLRRGPILQATPPYQPGATLKRLVADGLLTRALLERGSDQSLPATRPLYRHQEEAIRAIAQGRNLIVATGTGSGKTECYLLPIVDHLLRERDAGTLAQPGVRALLLYPMNALANDQLKRIRELLAPYPDITFGRYVGDTEREPRRALDRFRAQFGHDPQPGELIDRAAMQERPPHILLTNYAMLEYLLLRPQDSTLFDGPTGRFWRFVVLDEIHVYDGARGSELGLLLRRVRDRVHRSEHGKLQVVGTSATLGNGADDRQRVADFALAIFDEAFAPNDVLLPSRLPMRAGDARWRLELSLLQTLHGRWASGDLEGMRHALAGHAPADALADRSRPVEGLLWDVLSCEEHTIALQDRLETASIDLHDVASRVFRDDWRGTDVVKLVDLAVAARRDEASAPLLPARYHVFLRASEGAFVCHAPQHPAGVPRLLLDRNEFCPACDKTGTRSRVFEIAVCRHCGADYLVGRLEDGKLRTAPGHQSTLVNLLRAAMPTPEEADEDEDAAADVGAETAPNRAVVCLSCGALGSGEAGCDCGGPVLSVIAADGMKPTRLGRCLACMRRSNSGVALRFLSGSEAPVSVIATTLYQHIPPSPAASLRASAGGRKLLMFSDSRQDAAFFAPYLGRTYRRAVERRLVWQAIQHDPEPMGLNDLRPQLRRAAEDSGFLDENNGRTNLKEVETWLLAEVLATDRRQSLDGIGLADLRVRIPARATAPAALAPLGLTDAEALDVVRVLLDTVRQAAAVSVPDANIVKEDPRFGPRNTVTQLRREGSEPGVLAWVPSRGLNKRVDYLTKLAERRSVSLDAREILSRLWIDDLTSPSSAWSKVFVRRDDKRVGTVFGLDPAMLEFHARGSNVPLYRCNTCRQYSWRSVAAVCPTYRCTGTLVPAPELDENHYRTLYESLDPFPLTVEEHTGQLRAERAGELQQQFVEGKVNALSCSTTFELGVDVGEVQAVLLRNVPPSPANYVQRAGRAGRRLGSPALVTTFAQRRSHDLHYFAAPDALVEGHVAPPIVATDNDAIARRHVHAVAFAMFERGRVDAGRDPVRTIGEFIEPAPGGSIAEQFEQWLESRPKPLYDALWRMLTSDLRSALGITGWEWVERLRNPDEHGVGGWLTNAIDEARSDLARLQELEDEASEKRNHNRAALYQRTRKTLYDRRLLDFLAQRGVLPKYGFPVDVVELDLSYTGDTRGVELERDLRLGILEFAPGAGVVAASTLWKSTGIKRAPGRELPVYRWGICDGCEALRTEVRARGDDAADRVHACPHCGSTDFKPGMRGSFVIPMFGFIGQKDKNEPGETRPPREGRIETYFQEFQGPPESEQIALGAATITVRSSRRGWITVFNRGRTGHGFRMCLSCGHATDELPKGKLARSHAAPVGGRDCNGMMGTYALGHRFLTNVIELSLPLGHVAYPRDAAARSALEALLSALPMIGIAQNDVGGSLSYGGSRMPVVVLFDDVPGGAGHTRFIRSHLPELVRAAVQRVERCTCGWDTSCYGCLRTYRNQAEHDSLVRQAAFDVLAPLV